MKRDEDSLMNPPLEELRKRIPHKYELVLAATKRAKQILRQQRINPMSMDDEAKNRKPLSIALMDILSGRVDRDSLTELEPVFDDYIEESSDFFSDQLMPPGIVGREDSSEDLPDEPVEQLPVDESKASEEDKEDDDLLPDLGDDWTLDEDNDED
jgi:DNA-directed RNA polymerase omega subunit